MNKIIINKLNKTINKDLYIRFKKSKYKSTIFIPFCLSLINKKICYTLYRYMAFCESTWFSAHNTLLSN